MDALHPFSKPRRERVGRARRTRPRRHPGHDGERPDAPEHGAQNLDLFHARRFAALPACRVTRHAASDHTVVLHLKRKREIDATLLTDIFDVDPALLHRRHRLHPLPSAGFTKANSLGTVRLVYEKDRLTSREASSCHQPSGRKTVSPGSSMVSTTRACLASG